MRKLYLGLLAIFMCFGLLACGEKSMKTAADNKAALMSLLQSSTKPAVIKFYASWCSSCKQYAPIFEGVKNEMSSSVDFYEIDVDDTRFKTLVKELRIARIPETAFVSQDRKNISKKLGPISASKLRKMIQDLKAS